MPVVSPISLRQISREEFARLDYQIMRLAFDCQNELGRLCDEIIYQNDLAARILEAGLGPVRTEVPVTVTHLDFKKIYRLDLVVGDVAIYELKTANNLVPDNDAQLLNYLFLTGANHGKVINFRPAQVEARFVNASLTMTQRRCFEIDTKRWREPTESDARLRKILEDLLADWGGFLDLALYTDALVHFLGGEQQVEQNVPLVRNNVALGNQRMRLMSPDTAFRLTALTENPEVYERHLRSLLRISPLKVIQWINLAHHYIQFVTLEK